MSRRLRKLSDVRASFERLGAQVSEPAPNVLAFPTLWGDNLPAYIKWDGPQRLVLLSQPLPPVPLGQVGRVAVAIQRAHLDLAVLGFVLNPDTGALDFRTHLNLQPDGSVRAHELHRTFTFVVQTAERLGPKLHEAAGASADPDPWWGRPPEGIR